MSLRSIVALVCALSIGLGSFPSFAGDIISCDGFEDLTIGDTGPGGGIVFHITDGGLHGLEVSPVDLGPAPWGCVSVPINGADDHAVGSGAQNTADIIAGCGENGIAAKVAAAYGPGWFLPSREELNLLYEQKDVVGGFFSVYYWSSTEVGSDGYYAWRQSFGPDYIVNLGSRSSLILVRAVQVF